MLWMGVLCLIYMICALRTNVVFVLIFAGLVPAFCCLAGAYWQLALGNATAAEHLVVAAGALTFFVDLCGWWIFFAILLAALDFPFQLPGKSIIYNTAYLCLTDIYAQLETYQMLSRVRARRGRNASRRRMRGSMVLVCRKLLSGFFCL